MARSFRVRPLGDDRFELVLPTELREFLVHLATELDPALDEEMPAMRRLFPTAYPEDPEQDAGYQILARSELSDARRAAISTVQQTHDNEVLTEDELTDWMALTNDLRLVLGTKLDVAEDDTYDDLDPLDPRLPVLEILHVLGSVLHEIVVALSDALPGPPRD